jgi:hypothetical protein
VTTGERRVFKATLRAALRGQARGLALAAPEEAALARLIQFQSVDPYMARLLAAWALGHPPVTVLAFHERCSPKTLQTRLAAVIDRYLGA